MLLAPMVGLPARSRSRSQLAGISKNTTLANLGGAFGTARFTCWDSARALRMDHVYLSKVLSRLRKASLLRVVEKRPRGVGGLRYLYEVTPKGWKRIRYLQGRPEAAAQGTRDQFDQIAETSYLINGQGHIGDFFAGIFLKHFPHIRVPSVMDETGALLCSLDQGFYGVELCRHLILNMRIDPELKSYLATKMRAEGLQKLGYIPNNVPLSTFVPNALSRGSTENALLLSLALRRVSELRLENMGLKVYKAVMNRTEVKVESHVYSDLRRTSTLNFDLIRDCCDAKLKCAAEAQQVSENNMFLLDVANTLGSFDSGTMVTILKCREKLDLHPFRAGSTEPSVLLTRNEILLNHVAKQDILIDYLLTHIDRKSDAFIKLRLIILKMVFLNIKERDRIDRI